MRFTVPLPPLALLSYRFPDLSIHKAITGEKVRQVLDQLKEERGLPRRIEVDNGPEFISKALDAWAYFSKVAQVYSRPGTPTDNAYIESFNGSLRDECQNTNWFMSLDDAREKVERWKNDCNRPRPHSTPTYLTPEEFALLGNQGLWLSRPMDFTSWVRALQHLLSIR